MYTEEIVFYPRMKYDKNLSCKKPSDINFKHNDLKKIPNIASLMQSSMTNLFEFLDAVSGIGSLI